MTRRLMLLDTASLYFRAFYGVPDTVRAPDGTPVNAVRGLLDFLATLVSTYEPTDLVCCWDEDWRPQWRVDLLPSYKQQRVAEVVPGGTDVEEAPDDLGVQVPVIVEVLAALDLAVVGAPGCEADDVIGTLAHRADSPVDVVTGDRDLFQVVVDKQPPVRVLYTARGIRRIEVVNESTVVAKYGVLPAQYADFATLRGDPSDGLPGVAGIGEKTAASLLAAHGDLAGIVAAAADSSSSMSARVRRNLLDATDYLQRATRVVAVETAAPLPRFDPRLTAPTEEVRERVTVLAERWGLGGSAVRALGALAAADTGPAADAGPAADTGPDADVGPAGSGAGVGSDDTAAHRPDGLPDGVA